MKTQMINRKKWDQIHRPGKVLFIRLQAMGDVVITLPYILGFKQRFPNIEIAFLTRKETESIPKSLNLFHKVYSLGGGRAPKKQLAHALRTAPKIRAGKYDVVIDLQNNKLSRLLRKIAMPKAWAEFDRYSPTSAGDRTKNTIEAVGLGNIKPYFNLNMHMHNGDTGLEALMRNGWKPDHDLVVLNPAGFFVTRNWPLAYYVEFCNLWMTHYKKHTQFLMLGLGSLKEKAHYLRQHLGGQLIDLTGLTSPAEAFSILKKAVILLTEDSGLMHMAWVSGIPTLALFGSSRSDWSRPLGAHSLCLDSSDLSCGNCMSPQCKFGDVRCLTRYTPEFVFGKALGLVQKSVNT